MSEILEKANEIMEEAYYAARCEAATETRLSIKAFLEECPWTVKEIFPDLEEKYR